MGGIQAGISFENGEICSVSNVRKETWKSIHFQSDDCFLCFLPICCYLCREQFGCKMENNVAKRPVIVTPEVRPTRFDTLMQSKSITFASYNYTRMQYNVLLHIKEELQTYLTKHPSDLDGIKAIVVPLYCTDYPHFRGDTKAFYLYMQEFINSNNGVVFNWKYDMHDETPITQWMRQYLERLRGIGIKHGEVISQSSVIMTHVFYGTSSGTLGVAINPTIIPFLLYIGAGIDYTTYIRSVADSFKSFYSSRIYEMICDWSSLQPSYVISIDSFKAYFKLNKDYENRDLKRNILEVAKKEIAASSSPVKFTYEMKFDPQFVVQPKGRKAPVSEVSSGRKMANTIVFYFEYSDGNKLLKKRTIDSLVLLFKGIADPQKISCCERLAVTVYENGQAKKIRSKFLYYNKRLSLQKCSKEYCRNVLLKVVRELTGTDLRSDKHIRNAMIQTKKNSPEPMTLFPEYDS